MEESKIEQITIRQELISRPRSIKAEDQTEKGKQQVSSETMAWRWFTILSVLALGFLFFFGDWVATAIADKALGLSKIQEDFNESHESRLAHLEKLRDLVNESAILDAVGTKRFGAKWARPSAEELAKRRWALNVSGYLAVEKALMQSCTASRQQLASRRVNP